MKRISTKSRIEVWDGDYINNSTTTLRQSEDLTDKVNIIQIEPGSSNGDYMVEVEPKEDEDDQSKNKLIFATGKLSAMNIIVNRLIEEYNNPNRDWFGSSVYSEIRDVLLDIEREFKDECDNASGEPVSK